MFCVVIVRMEPQPDPNNCETGVRLPVAAEPDEVPIERWATNVRNILRQITDARNDEAYTIFASADYRNIRISNFSRFDPDHFLALQTGGPHMAVHVHSHSLPDLFAGAAGAAGAAGQPQSSVFPAVGTIESFCNLFQLYLEQLDTFYDWMHTIDAMCFVVEPTLVTTRSRSRTFKIAANIFVRITVDPLAPSSLVCTIIGPSYGTAAFRQLYDERIRDWDPQLDIHQNLLRIFGLAQFPMRPTEAAECAEDEEGKCGICLEYRCGRQVPIVSCDNRRCEVVFHTECLRNWFQTLPDSRTILDVTFGSCPYCKDKLSTSFVCLLTEIA